MARPGSILASAWMALAGIAVGSFAAAADLAVTVEAVRSDAGQVKLMLFDKADGFRKEDQALRILSLPARTGSLLAVMDNLNPGTYALVVYHDENNDGKLNMRLGMFPKEGYGLSNNPKVSGPPRFRESAFEFSGHEVLAAIRLHY